MKKIVSLMLILVMLISVVPMQQVSATAEEITMSEDQEYTIPENTESSDSNTPGEVSGVELMAVEPRAAIETIVIGDYEFAYKATWDYLNKRWIGNSTYNGWTVKLLDTTKSQYEPLPDEVDDRPVVNLFDMYSGCKNIVNTDWIHIPKNTMAMDNFLNGATSLTRASFTIPNTVQSVISLLKDCTTVEDISGIHFQNGFNPTKFNDSFSYCTSIKVFPSSIPAKLATYNLFKGYGGGSSSSAIFEDSSLFPDLVDPSGNIVFSVDGDTINVSSSIKPDYSNFTIITLKGIKRVNILSGGNISGKIFSIPKVQEVHIYNPATGVLIDAEYPVGVGFDLYIYDKLPSTSLEFPIKNLYFTDGVTEIVNNSTTQCSLTVAENVHLPSTLTSFVNSDYVKLIGKGANSKLVVPGGGLPNLVKFAVIGSNSAVRAFNVGDIVLGPQVTDISGLSKMSGAGSIKAYKNTYAASIIENNANNPNLGFILLDTVEASSIVLNVSNVLLGEGRSFQLRASVRPTTTTDQKVTWKSLNESVATVSDKGLVTGITEGTTSIISTSSNGLEAECLITVKKLTYPTDIVVPDAISIEAGARESIPVTFIPIWSDVKKCTFVSSDVNIAYVNEAGEVFGVSVGNTLIAVTCEGIQKNVNVTVTPKLIKVPVEIEEPVYDATLTNNSLIIPLVIRGDVDYIELPNGNKFYGVLTEYTVFENGFYSFTVHGKDGSVSSQSITVTNIDKDKPVIKLTYGIDFTSVAIKGIDANGVKRIEVPDDTQSVNADNLVYNITKDSDYGTIVTYDNAGNISEKDIFIKSTGSAGATVYVAYEGIPTDWTNKDVEIRAAAYSPEDMAESVVIVQEGGSAKGRSKPALRASTMVASNGTYKVVATSKDGSSHEEPFEVNRIDKTAPIISVTVKEGVATYTMTDELSGIRIIALPDGSTIEKLTDGVLKESGSISMNGAESVTFVVHDFAGNTATYTTPVEPKPEPPTPGGGGSGGGSTTPPTADIPEPEVPGSGETDGKDKDGNNFELEDGLIPNKGQLRLGYISGYEDVTVKGNGNTSREEFAMMMDRILILSSEKSKSFVDVSTGWSSDSISRLAGYGLLKGVGDNKFDPKRPITREEVALILSRVVNLSRYSAVCSLTDIEDSYAMEAIAKLYNAGVIDGSTGMTFNPKMPITRAEIVKMLNRIFLGDIVPKHNKFKDLDKKDWYYEDVLKAVIE